MEASVEVTEDSVNAFVEVTKVSVELLPWFRGSYFHESFRGSFRESFRESFLHRGTFVEAFVKVTSMEAFVEDFVIVAFVKASITFANACISSMKASMEAFVEAPVEVTSVEAFIS